MFARPSTPSARSFAVCPLDWPGREGLAARLNKWLISLYVINDKSVKSDIVDYRVLILEPT